MTSTPTPDVYLLDTSIASIAWDGGHNAHALVRAQLDALGESTLTVCAISVGEVLYGLDVTPGADPARHQTIHEAMQTYYTWPVDGGVAEPYSKLRGELFRRYAPRNRRGLLTAKRPEELQDATTAQELGIQENDLWIVSVAIHYNLRLITRDERLKRVLEIAKEQLQYDRYDIWPVSKPSRPDTV